MSYTDYNDIPVVITVPELATILRIGRHAAYDLVRSNQIHSIRMCNKIRVPKDALIEFLETTDI